MSTAIKHDWYQTEKTVVVNVMIKNANQENCRMTLEPDRLLIEADGGLRLELHLYESINVEKSFNKFGSVKVEVTLAKLVDHRWPELTKEKAEVKPTVATIYRRDWDSVAKAIETDKPEGDEAVNELFSQIYMNSSPDVRRAMNKSFSESNGTVLSTDWKEIGAGKTPTKPPDGTEFRKWDEV
ncbi:Protein SGT1 like [Pseudolycoriella hygida]|uniref:Protein SGT1 like n=1 Tax=Pseudolycoriella hygida TaxID=35572 RepID=A0A9Q0N287_9DIPT|nr:Protein SGT1 like [Pseudolycoriella hygida]